MKKFIAGFFCAFCLLMVAATVRNSGFYITGDYGGEPMVAAEQNNQTADWIRFTSNGIPVFNIPANGGLSLTDAVIFTGVSGKLYTNSITTGIVR